jgi:hypothetical protein
MNTYSAYIPAKIFSNFFKAGSTLTQLMQQEVQESTYITRLSSFLWVIASLALIHSICEVRIVCNEPIAG